jgi:hypothetical protein
MLLLLLLRRVESLGLARTRVVSLRPRFDNTYVVAAAATAAVGGGGAAAYAAATVPSLLDAQSRITDGARPSRTRLLTQNTRNKQAK